MMVTLVLILVAVVVGIAVALQAQFVGSMDRAVGSVTSTFVAYGLGGVLATLIWLVRGQSLSTLRRAPAYTWSAGALGLVIVGGIGYVAPRLGLSRAIVITVAAQLLASVVIDHFGLFGATARPIDLTRTAGLMLAITGAWLVVRT